MANEEKIVNEASNNQENVKQANKVNHNLFDVNRLDESFYRAYKNAHKNETVRDAIATEMKSLADHNEFSVMAKNENILIAGANNKKGYTMNYANLRDLSIGSFNRVVDKLINSAKDFSDDQSDVSEYVDNLKSVLNTCEKKSDIRRVEKRLLLAEANNAEYLSEQQAIREAYAKNMFGLSMIDAEVILGSVDQSYNSSFKGSQVYNNLLSSYNKAKQLDLTKALEIDTIDSTAEILKELNKSVVEFKYQISDKNNLSENDKNQRDYLRRSIIKNQKLKYNELTQEIIKSYDDLSQKVDSQTADAIIESCLVLNRVNKKLSAPNYNFDKLTMRGAIYLDEVLSQAENQSKMLTQIKDNFKDEKIKKRAINQRSKIDNDPSYRLPTQYFRNALVIDEYLDRARHIINSELNEGDLFSDLCNLRQSIANSYAKAHDFVNGDNDVNPIVSEEIKNAMLNYKLHRSNETIDILGQMMDEATVNMTEDQKASYRGITYELLTNYSNIMASSVQNIYNERDVVDENTQKHLSTFNDILNKQGRFENVNDREKYVYTLGACDLLIYNMTKDEQNKFNDLFLTNMTALDNTIAKYKDFEEVRETSNAIVLAFRDTTRPLSIENKYSYFNKDLISNLYGIFEHKDKQIKDEGISRVRNFFATDWEAPASDKTATRNYFSDVVPYSEDDTRRNVAITQNEPQASPNSKVTAALGPAVIPESNEKISNENEKPQNQESDNLDLKFYPSFKDDVKDLKGISKKYAGDFNKDYARFWWAFAFVMLAVSFIAALFIGGATIGGLSAAIIMGGVCAYKYKSYLDARDNEDIKRTKEISEKYGIKFNKKLFLLSPDLYCDRLAKKITKVNRLNDLKNDFLDPTGEYRKNLLQDQEPGQEQDKIKEQEVEKSDDKPIETKQETSTDKKEPTTEAEVEKDKPKTEEVKPDKIDDAQKPTEVKEDIESKEQTENGAENTETTLETSSNTEKEEIKEEESKTEPVKEEVKEQVNNDLTEDLKDNKDKLEPQVETASNQYEPFVLPKSLQKDDGGRQRTMDDGGRQRTID